MSIDKKVCCSKRKRISEIVEASDIVLKQPSWNDVRNAVHAGTYKTWYGKSTYADEHTFLYPAYLKVKLVYEKLRSNPQLL
jgi:hypothetical protein